MDNTPGAPTVRQIEIPIRVDDVVALAEALVPVLNEYATKHDLTERQVVGALLWFVGTSCAQAGLAIREEDRIGDAVSALLTGYEDGKRDLAAHAAGRPIDAQRIVVAPQ